MLKKWLRIGLGLIFIVLGIIGALLPIIPGFVFLIPGLVILADYFPPARKVLEWAKAKAAAAKQN